MGTPLFVVDAFAERAFAGNPAAVCLLEAPPGAAWAQAVAGEMKHSETAFVSPRDDGFDLRWFTPAVEVDLCGHATLASAHVLFTEGRAPDGEPIRFHTGSGVLACARAGNAIEMDFPADPVSDAAIPDGLERALGAPIVWAGTGRIGLVLELASEEAVRALEPDLDAVARAHPHGVLVTARASSRGFDFVSRYFAPNIGIDEDPVTGAAHCALAPLWSARLGSDALTGYQASARGGIVRVRAAGDRVFLRGEAVTVARGELLV